LHWRVYLPALGLFLIGAALIGAGGVNVPPLTISGFVLLLISCVSALDAWVRRLTTEIIVTDKRVIWKRNWIAVTTREINISKIETVDIRQSIFDRLIDSGTVVISAQAVRGAHLADRQAPVLRNAIASDEDIPVAS